MTKRFCAIWAFVIGIAVCVSPFAVADDTPSKRKPIELSLTMEGDVWKLSHTRGKITLLSFGYTFCPDICPTTLSTLAQTLDMLNETERAQVKTFFISLDPKRDTSSILKKYTASFHPDIKGITGSMAEIRTLTTEMGVDFSLAHQHEAEDDFYSVDHSPLMFVIDETGRQRYAIISHVIKPVDLADVLRTMLAKDTS